LTSCKYTLQSVGGFNGRRRRLRRARLRRSPRRGARLIVSVIPGGGGSGQVTSQPAGIDCTIANGSGSGACTSAFPVGTVVRLDARPAANSSFVGFRQSPGCFDASKITVARGVTITCQVGFVLR
jgi:hypothetical protein